MSDIKTRLSSIQNQIVSIKSKLRVVKAGLSLKPPFAISSRLLPALKVGGAWISLDEDGQFIIDLPGGEEYKTTDFRPGHSRGIADMFADILGFLDACAESRDYGRRMKNDPMAGENSDLFPENVATWAESCQDELSMLSNDIENSEDLITETNR